MKKEQLEIRLQSILNSLYEIELNLIGMGLGYKRAVNKRDNVAHEIKTLMLDIQKE